MNRSIKNRILLAVCGACALLSGCFPEDSLDWSADGSVGLLSVDAAFYLVDGQSGKLTTVASENVLPWPGIARDGSQIVYSDEITLASLAEGLRTLPPGQMKMIERDAESLRATILSSAGTATDLNAAAKEAFAYDDPYRSWVIRYACERADAVLTAKLGAERVQEGKELELTGYRLITVTRSNPENKKIVATSALGLFRPRFSPDARHIAYLVSGDDDSDTAHLFVAAPQQNMPAVHVASRVALSFDWSKDGHALAYAQQEAGDTILGVIVERQLCDNDGRLLAETSTDPSTKPLELHHCTGPTKQLVGTLFNPLMKVEYGEGGRLFFASASGRIPTSDLDEPQYLLFCYDSLTGTVADVLPADAPGRIGQTISFFSLSPDGRRVLLPMENNRFAIYELGTKSLEMPIPEDEGFGEEMPTLLPSWKGNDKVSCLVSEESHFLASDGEQIPERKEIIVLSAGQEEHRVLSDDWPADAIP